MKVSLDTNILIDDPSVVFDKGKEFVISFTVIRELDKLKRNPDLKRAAQSAIVNIWHAYREKSIEIINIPKTLGDSPDEQIIQDTKDYGLASILSNDIAVRLIADAHGVEISTYEAETPLNYDYKGYTQIEGTLDYEKNFMQLKEMQHDEFKEFFGVDLKENEYCIIERIVPDKYDIWVNKSDHVTRISQSMKPYRDAGILLDPMDPVQMCALDAVFDPKVPLTVIDGKLGTGKTLLTLMAALACSAGQRRYRVYDKILVTKPPVSINKDLYTGFKPGSSEDKMSGHLGGLKSNLKFLLDRKGSKGTKVEYTSAEGGTIIEKLSESDLVWKEVFGVMEIDEIQGVSLHDTILLVDEWQLLDEDAAKLVISRVAEGSKLVLIGDTAGQTYGMNRANEGYKILYRHLGMAPEFNYIKLENIYRSPLAKFVSKVFEDE